MQQHNQQMYFNSIKVRLEPSLFGGAISGLLFQFHKGTIRTLPLYAVGKTVRDFNSIKVRLEHFNQHGNNTPLVNFNSIKVRLELKSKVASS